jgi:purine-binding chemotaxis protein CheW
MSSLDNGILNRDFRNSAEYRDSANSSLNEKHLVLFKLSGEEFGVDIGEVREIIKMESITKIPNTADYIVGAINLRGAIITVINLAKKLGLESRQSDKNTRIIVIELKNSVVGMIVDSATEVLRLRGDQFQPTPQIIGSQSQKRVNSAFIAGIGTLKDRMIILLDLKKVIESKEIENLKSI